MATVNTVTGPVDSSELGRTLIHEHLYITFEGADYDIIMPFDKKAFVRDAVNRLKALKEHGVQTFVDPCPIDLGRDVSLMREVSEKAEMNIVCATGFYWEKYGLPLYWRYKSAEQIAELYIHEIEKGIENTGIKAGVIKVATGEPVISDVEAPFAKAAAMASKATGVPIVTHTELGCCGPDQQKIFRDNGADPHRCMIGHSCGNPDPAYHKEIVDNGTYIGFDRIGYETMQPDELRADNVVKLLDGGYKNQLMMAQDRFCHLRGMHILGKIMEMSQEEIAAAERSMQDGTFVMPFTDIFTEFFPKLRARGVSEDDLNHIMDVNPGRFFSGVPF